MVPPQRRRQYWSDVLAESFPGMTTNGAQDLRADLSRWKLGPTGLARARSSRTRVSRVVNQDGHNVVLHLLRKGRMSLEHDRNVVTAGIGDIVIADDCRPYAIEISDANDCLIMQMPAALLGESYQASSWHGRVLRAGDPNVGFFDYMLRGLWGRREQFCEIDDGMGDVLAQAALIACRSAVSAPCEEQSSGSPVEFALRHFDNPELRTTTICHATGLTPRAVQKAFLRETGQTPTAFITERRLEQSARLIANTEAATITEVAFAVGYSDSAYFSRKFRDYFGTAPSQFREAKLRGH